MSAAGDVEHVTHHATKNTYFPFGGLFPRPPPEGMFGFLLGAFGGTGLAIRSSSFHPGSRQPPLVCDQNTCSSQNAAPVMRLP